MFNLNYVVDFLECYYYAEENVSMIQYCVRFGRAQ